jgi:glycosyltransferase involved in cell wall biosynthesis
MYPHALLVERMNVLYFHQYFSTPNGATGTRSYEMATRLIERGHSVTMVCGSAEASDTGLTIPFRWGCRKGVVDGINIIEFNPHYSNNQSFIRRSVSFMVFAIQGARIALFYDTDIVFATSTPLTAGIPGLVARWIRRRRFVFEVRDLWPELPAAMGIVTNRIVLGLMRILELVSYKSAHKLIGLSPGIVDGIVQNEIPASDVVLIPNGCDLRLFENAPDSWRPDGIGEDDFMAVYAGAHGLANGLGAILDAAAELIAAGRENIKIVIVGNGALKSFLEERAKSEHLNNCVFLEPVSKHRLAGLFSSADIGLQVLKDEPSFYYGTSPNKFFDYLASGLPVLVNYPGWVADIISANGCGFVCQPNDSKCFANALVDARSNKMALSLMRNRSSFVAETMFNRDVLANTFINIL